MLLHFLLYVQVAPSTSLPVGTTLSFRILLPVASNTTAQAVSIMNANPVTIATGVQDYLRREDMAYPSLSVSSPPGIGAAIATPLPAIAARGSGPAVSPASSATSSSPATGSVVGLIVGVVVGSVALICVAAVLYVRRLDRTGKPVVSRDAMPSKGETSEFELEGGAGAFTDNPYVGAVSLRS